MDLRASAVLSRWYGTVPRCSKTAFLSAWIAGSIAHIFAVSNTLFNHDYTLREARGILPMQGKWFSDLSYQMDAGDYSIPLAVITAIAALALSAALLADVLQLRSRVWSAALGAALAVFPSAMEAQAYRMNFWDIFLAVLALWLIWRLPGRRGWLSGAAVLTLSLGIYQAYIGFAAAGLLLYCAQEVLRPGSTLRSIWARAMRSLTVLLASIGAYCVVLKIYLRVHDLQLDTYKGIDKALNHFDWKALPGYMAEGYVQVFRMLWEDAYGSQAYHIKWLYRAALLLLVAGALLVVWDRALLRSPAKLAMLALFIGLYPMAVHLIYALSLGVPTSWITRYPFVMLFIALFKLGEMTMRMLPAAAPRTPRQWLAAAHHWLCLFLAVALCYVWTVMTHEGYLRMKLAFYGAYAMENKIAQDIYSCPGYDEDAEVALIGLSEQKTEDEFFKQYDAYTGIMDKNFIFSYGEQPRFFLEMWLQTDFRYADAQTAAALRQSDAFAAMPVYPQPGYVQVLDGVIVAKFSE